MSEWKPTTEFVREAYESGALRLRGGYRLHEFDRWFAEVKAQVWEEAYMTGVSDVIADKGATMNPYRQGETE